MSEASNSPAFQEWIEEASNVAILDELARRGITMRGSVERAGPCPVCGGKDGFSINTSKGVFNCRRAGNLGGDVIAMVEHIDACSFTVACETLTGRPPPGRERSETEEERQARQERVAARAEENRRRSEEEARREAEARERDAVSVERIWKDAQSLAGSHAAAYLEARGLTPPARLMTDIRFVPELGYYGLASDDARESTLLGSFPAMVALVRAADGSVIGLHRTYLDPKRPAKLKPPGSNENKAKKVMGEAKGGMIRLGEIGDTLAVGEGIETVLSWYVLGLVDREVTLATSISLGNLSGSATGSVRHPKRKRADGSPQPIPNGEPDLDRPGIILPSQVRRVILLGDGDSDPETTRARLLVAARRFRQQGREVAVSMAPQGCDFNDVLMQELGIEVAA